MLTLPAFANCHSHAFHRALRGRVAGAGSFWSWREQMYALAGVLDPDLMFNLAKATYGEMRLAGIGVVGEFHYLHHGPGGAPYDDPNAMGEALIAAAREAGIRICLLDACYLAARFLSTSSRGKAPEGVQLRFSDGSAEDWASRVAALKSRYEGADDVVIGAAIHSVRAVPADQLATVAEAFPDAPLHVHLSEQPAENEECLAATGLTPTDLLAEAGVWTSRTTAVHATHLIAGDIHTIGEAASFVCFCPTTERELADGIGPSVALRNAGARLTLGSDSNTVIDMFEEARAVEMNERLASGVRGAWSVSELLEAATATGYESLGFVAGDQIQVSTDSVRMAGVIEPLWAASSADVIDDPGTVAEDLQSAIYACWSRI